MYRFLLTPRWWAINLFLVTAVPFCLFMGSWQLSRFEDRAAGHRERETQTEQIAQQRAKPLAELMPVDKQTSGKVAEARGTYDTENQFLSPGRTLEGERGSYVVTLLRTDDGGPIEGADEDSERVLPVVRGWLAGEPAPEDVPAPPRGEVTVSGALQSSETTGGETGLPAGQLDRISAASLVNLVSYDVYNAWITVVDPEQLPQPLKAVPPVAPKDTGLDLKAFQNLGYTAEWFVFAAFVAFMWFRFFRREVEVARDAAMGIVTPPPGAAKQPAPTGATAGATSAGATAETSADTTAGATEGSDGPGPEAASGAEDGPDAEAADRPEGSDRSADGGVSGPSAPEGAAARSSAPSSPA
ncbi:SURF1 family protein [Streptomyces sp. XM4193]|uniref:SURF1 family protein n=1 Tax=Streptomyces sp. XM4193 TaxID=2929782 RepID=UPI001FF9BC6E|nr:SURF1 family protein [Streptomyces sp. XM4193]MCK1795049.1 SURF1 family protein [Streptomyces sp. XM4193]